MTSVNLLVLFNRYLVFKRSATNNFSCDGGWRSFE